MLFRDLTIDFADFKGFEGDVDDLRAELAKMYPNVGHWEDTDGTGTITLYDWPMWGSTKTLDAFCEKYGVNLYDAWKNQRAFDKICAEAVAKKW